ncbi:hypothetical protein BVC80_1787g12 [Macleaya cordata]|uniref:Uncharacterized protein n=1 Tax=Macleaya cordata TaxID=56857 RepID=A0A200QU24_MACCD|nr:hypothetical protein BVC80_1787g12 [Macleaya cordata]
MSVENEDQCVPTQQVETMQETPKRSRISYSRDFLLSLSELDVCKKLPKGFDPSILSDFGEASNSIPEWPRPPGSFSSQSYRRGEYGSSPPTRGEGSNYSRGIHGRWDTRSSGSNDRDTDSQSDKDSDSGRRYGNQPRRTWQNPEHDGLLGSGAFPRPSGYTAGASAPKVRGNGYQLNKTNEPYHPPRPYKAVPHSRREITDSINDETFGSSEYSSQDREEEERKRRASFELFRKENQKAYQEKTNQFSDKNSENYDPDIAALLKDSESKFCNESNGPEDVSPPASQSDSAISAPPTASRPLVPPGFRSSILEKNLVTKPLVPHPPSEVGSIELEDSFNGTSDNQDGKNPVKSMDSSVQKYKSKIIHVPFTDVSEKMIRPSEVKASDNSVGIVHPSFEASNLLQAYEAQQGGVADFDNEKMPGHEILGKTGQERSASILEKLFGGAITVSIGSSTAIINFSTALQSNDVKADDTESQIPYQSSKFSHWFGEEKKPSDDLSSGQPKDLLSLIVSADKGRPQLSELSDEKSSEHIQPAFPFKNNEPEHRFISSTATSAAVGIHEPPYHSNSQDTAPRVLTCEDLEQSILSEINDNSSHVQHPVQAWGMMDPKVDQPKPEVNNLASQHILSLLQKGTIIKDSVPSSKLDVQSSDNLHVYEGGSINTLNNSSVGGSEVPNPENTLTLETFFGTSFMKELQSAQAPVSVQRGSIGGTARTEFSGPHGFPFPVADAGFGPSDVSEYGSNKTILEDDISKSNLTQQTKSSKTEKHLLGFDVHPNEMGFNLSAIGGFESRPDRAVEIQLPEEESLITLGDAMNPQNPMFMQVGNANKGELVSSSNVSLDIVDKLAALNAALKDERSMVLGHDGPPFLRGPYNPLEPEIPYQNMRGQPSSPPFPHLQMSHGRPLMQPLDSHHTRMNPQMKFMGPESIIHHEQPHHQFPANVFHHPSLQHAPGGPTRFDPPSQNHMLQHMHVPGHFPPPHLLQGHPRGAPLPPHPINHMAGHIPEADPMQGFHFHRQPNYGGLGIPVPAPGVGVGGSNHPDAFGKLIEMELRANSKQMHPVVGPGTYGHEVDMSFRYR